MTIDHLSLPRIPVVSSLPNASDYTGCVVVFNSNLWFSNGTEWRNLSAEFPIGSVLITVSNTNPATFLGYGTWSQFGQGRCLVGVDTADTDFDTPLKTGGAKTHTLTIQEIPSHSHTYTRYSSNTSNAPTGTGITGVWSGTNSSISTNATGGGQPHNNLQPYITVYFWRRTA